MTVKVEIRLTGKGADDSNIEALEQLEKSTLSEARAWAENKALDLKIANGIIMIAGEYGTSLIGTITSGSFEWVIRNV